MAEYIDREAMLKRIKDDFVPLSLAMVFNHIHNAPAADVVPVVHGRWDSIPNMYMSVISKDRAYHGSATTCSVCHEVNPNAYKTNYCPNCGAKMDKKEATHD